VVPLFNALIGIKPIWKGKSGLKKLETSPSWWCRKRYYTLIAFLCFVSNGSGVFRNSVIGAKRGSAAGVTHWGPEVEL